MEIKIKDLLLNEKEYKTAVNDAKRLWKADKRVITQTDNLTKEEAQAVADDPEIVLLAWQYREIQRALVAAVDMKLSELRNPTPLPDPGQEEVGK